jgi:C4-dicarboxylate transporter DctQ subunit
VFDRIVNAGAAIAAVLLVVVMLMTTVKIIFRYGLGEGLVGVDQISGTILLYIAFLGAPWVLRLEQHVTIDLLVGALKPGIQNHLHVFSSLLGAVVCLCLVVFGTLEVFVSLQKGIRIPAEIEYPRAFNLVVIPLGSLCLGVQFLRRAWMLPHPGPRSAPEQRD